MCFERNFTADFKRFFPKHCVIELFDLSAVLESPVILTALYFYHVGLMRLFLRTVVIGDNGYRNKRLTPPLRRAQ